MLEDILFGNIVMPGELIRVVVAFLGTAIATYYDIFNKKNVPDKFLYGFLAVSFVLNVVFFEESLFWFSIGVALFFSAIGYVFYRLGQLGGADVFVLASVMLLLPIHPSFAEMSFNIPFLFSILIFSGVLFALYVMGYFGWKLSQVEAKPKLQYLLMAIPYLLFAYVYSQSFLFSPLYFAFISVLLFATTFFMIYREPLMRLLAEELPVSQLEPEDVLALEIMNKDMVERYKLQRLLTEKEIERIKETKLKDVWVYTRLPPFLPFILVGMVMAILFAKYLLLF
ncbi:hypothetical protein KKF81_03480 [Candidatus Micrarchaeota archaeon]|nr:hypothetical protein [Candidatus Micrarchaeota archaeon]MBU1165985.1 hypothetical protein [Candidatus Micrarchaeota archaeon]MBU1886438.1 hypothetical protein [Candidatus Micrarchaeota archaeon]